MTEIQKLDAQAQNLARDYHRTEAELLEVLITLRRKKGFLILGYSGIWDYCQRCLKLSEAQSSYYKRVAEKSEEVPELKEAIEQGTLTLSVARRIVPVITKESSSEWIEKAATLKQRDLEREVSENNPSAHVSERIRPVSKSLSEMKLPITPETEADLKALQDILSAKRKHPASRADVVAWALKVMREKHDPIKKAQRAISSGKLKPKTVATESSRRISAAAEHRVRLRDENRCTYRGPEGTRCNATRFLHVHHIKYFAHGGSNDVNNLRVLCSAHHRLIHATSSNHAISSQLSSPGRYGCPRNDSKLVGRQARTSPSDGFSSSRCKVPS